MWNLFYQWNRVKGLLKDQKGQGMVEYALILTGVALVAVVGYKSLGNDISSLATNVGTNLKNP